MKTNLLFVVLVCSTSLLAQNNNIFYGGSDEGFAKDEYITPTNNSIFGGGHDEGFAKDEYITPTNNSIFGGGHDEGFAKDEYITPTNNSIFGGGYDEGFATGHFFDQNYIFNGGTDDGFAMNCSTQAHNDIFAGGNADGFGAEHYQEQNSLLDISVILQGPYNGVGMNDALRSLSTFPLQEPYSPLGYDLQNAHCTTTQAILDANNIVDWVIMQIRVAATDVFASRAALLRNDGRIVDIDGVSYVPFVNIPQQAYFIVVQHRNHLGVMTDTPVFLAAGS